MVALAAPMVATPAVAGEGGIVSVPGIAEREIARRAARVEDARQAMEKGDELYGKGEYEAALAQYRAAKDILDQLPNAPFIQDWRNLANLKFADCAIVVAREKAKIGDYVAARKLIEEAQLAVPDHRAARIFAKHLDDPDRWPPALTPQHVENVSKVTKQLHLGHSAMEIGDYDKANLMFEEALRIDPYNSAARLGMQKTEQKRSEYFETARDHQRSRMLNMVNEAWEHKPPVRGLVIDPMDTGGVEPTVYLTRKMQEIVFPSVQFAGASIEEAVEFLRVKSRDLDLVETDPTKKGVNIILKAGDAPVTASISLDLKDVPMVEALRYVTELAGMKYKVEPFAVLIVPGSETTVEQFTRIYKVGPDFLTLGGSGGGDAAPAASADPFATGATAPSTGLGTRMTAIEILKSQGIAFPEGASAVFNRVSSQLIVKNTQPNLDLVEAFVEATRNEGPKQIYITSKFVEVSQKNTDELGFDWLLGTIGRGNDVQGGGGTDGNSGVSSTTIAYPSAVASILPGAGNALAGGVAPISRSLRTGGNAISGNAIDSLINGTPAVSEAPGVLSVAGVLTDPQFALVIRAMSQRKGVDLMSAPSVTAKHTQRATVEVVREFIYPTEFDPPQIPTNVGAIQGGGGGGGGSIPVTPTTPTAFEMRQVGVRMEVEPSVGADGYTIDLQLNPEVTEFDGFINYGSPINSVNPGSPASQFLDLITGLVTTTAAVPPSTVELTPNIINQPVFSVRRVTTNVTIWDGQTVVLGGLIREDVQDVEDKIPVLGDLPFIGRLFKSTVEDHFKRNLMIFVTAKQIDPAGQPINPNLSTSGGASAGAEASNLLLPPVGN
ncbi:Amuc_1098 family type IV pilus outer membrane protein [Prosthecobacter sp. SYSU 5D2]|uniref:Amuc_1098 family type IV pilus outer membrane protein n=1 Tax=Prosthecobacter sp. SYSU 5D2 TaxID=3134134 RepID=UPI0031FE5C9D